jgi:hypothetical protein
MASPTDIVLAGTKGFALALFAPLTERTGTRPRIAPEPQQALALCAGSTGVLVVEYGPAWLQILTQLRQSAPGLRVVAALPVGQEPAALALAPLGVEAVPWDGQPAALVATVERIAAQGPVQAPAPAPAPVTRPAVAPAAPPTVPRAPPRLATTPPGGTPAQPPPRPAPPTTPVTEAELFDGLEAPTPAAPSAAISDPFAAGSQAAPEHAPIPPYTGAPSGPASARPSTDWPSTCPTEAEAESALVLFVRGKLRPEAPLAAVTRQAVAAMSELERQALAGAPLPFDAQPVYLAAVLRLRVAAALASVPPPPARVDDPAVQALLAELDAALAKVNPLAAGAPPEHQPALEAIRNALVREAVDFSEAVHRLTSAGAPPPIQEASRQAPRGPSSSSRGQPATSRVLSLQSGEGEEVQEERRRRGPIAVLVAVLLLGAGYHAWGYLNRPAPVAPRTYDGAPAGTRALVTPNGSWLLAVPGASLDKAQLDRFKEQELKKGNKLLEVSPGRWKIVSAVDGGKGAKP